MTNIATIICESWNVTILECTIAGLTAMFEAITTIFSEILAAVTSNMSMISSIIISGVNEITSIIYGLISSAYGWGADFVANFAAGIMSRMSALLATVQAMAARIRSYLHFSEPDKGPLSDFHKWMPDFMAGLAEGIDKNRYLVEDAVSRVASDMVISPKMSMVEALSGYADAVKSASINHTGTIRVEGVNDKNTLTDVVDIIIDQLRREVRL